MEENGLYSKGKGVTGIQAFGFCLTFGLSNLELM
jgi:hypothetical protein